jgi:hemolysin D
MSNAADEPGREALIYHPSTVSWAVAETVARPPSFLGRLTLYTILAILAASVVYASLARVAVTISGRGMIRTSGKVRPVRAQVTGKIATLHVKNGQRVAAHEPLIDMEEQFGEQDLARFTRMVKGINDLLAKRDSRGAIADAATLADVPMRFSGSALAHERATLSEALSSYGQALRYQHEILPELVRADISEKRQNEEKLQKVQHMSAEGDFKSELLQLEQAIARLSVSVRDREEQGRGKLASARTSVEVNARTFEQALKTHTEDQKVVSPVEGVVSNMTVTGAGELITGGQSLLQIVPLGGQLVAEVQIANKDIGQLKPGMPVSLKLDAFPFQDYGMLAGRLQQLPEDVRSTDSKSSGSGSENYDVVVALDGTTVGRKGNSGQARLGMTLTADIKVRERTLLQLGLIEILKLKDSF